MGKFIDLARDVLLAAGKPMSAKEIWQYAQDNKYNVNFTQGRSPENTLSASLSKAYRTRTVLQLGRSRKMPYRYHLLRADDGRREASYLISDASVRARPATSKPSPRLTTNISSLHRSLEQQFSVAAKKDGSMLLAAIRRRRNKKPRRRKVSVWVYERDPNVVAYVRQRAQYKCEMPGCAWVGFVAEDGNLFVEVHHIIPLSEGGDDTPENAVALCPNCHRFLHYATETVRRGQRNALVAALKSKGVQVSHKLVKAADQSS